MAEKLTRREEKAFNDATTEYQYPTSNYSLGMKKVLGRGYLVQLINDNIYASKIPQSRKRLLMGEKVYDARRNSETQKKQYDKEQKYGIVHGFPMGSYQASLHTRSTARRSGRSRRSM